jgi:hypothetical protein
MPANFPWALMPDQIYDCGFCGSEVSVDEAVVVQLMGPPGTTTFAYLHKECSKALKEGRLKIRLVAENGGQDGGVSNGQID